MSSPRGDAERKGLPYAPRWARSASYIGPDAKVQLTGGEVTHCDRLGMGSRGSSWRSDAFEKITSIECGKPVIYQRRLARASHIKPDYVDYGAGVPSR